MKNRIMFWLAFWNPINFYRLPQNKKWYQDFKNYFQRIDFQNAHEIYFPTKKQVQFKASTQCNFEKNATL